MGKRKETVSVRENACIARGGSGEKEEGKRGERALSCLVVGSGDGGSDSESEQAMVGLVDMAKERERGGEWDQSQGGCGEWQTC